MVKVEEVDVAGGYENDEIAACAEVLFNFVDGREMVEEPAHITEPKTRLLRKRRRLGRHKYEPKIINLNDLYPTHSGYMGYGKGLVEHLPRRSQ